MNTPQDHIISLIQKKSTYSLSDQDNSLIQKKGIEAYLFSKVASKKFRKSKLSPECEIRIKKAIHFAVSHNDPIQFILPAGGYKLWSLPSAPEANWAEFFNVAHIIKYLAPLVAAYPQGAHFSYYLFTNLMQISDNLSPEDVSKYMDSFQAIISLFKPYLPSNITISIVKDTDFYSQQEYEHIFSSSLKEAQEIFDSFPAEKKEKYLKSSTLNIKWRGASDWTMFSDKERAEKIQFGALSEVAGGADFFPKIKKWVFQEDKIIIFPSAKKEFIGIGSTSGSITKHWTGVGILEEENGRFYERILAPSQYEVAKNITHKTVPISLNSPINLKEIEVYTNRFNFTQSK